jgi:hypothetical protein
MLTAAESTCLKVYEETRAFYAEKEPVLGSHAHGFRILHGPPVLNPPILFIGYQPGGTTPGGEGDHDGWPAKCVYTIERWVLWRRLREIWGTATLEKCTGLNLFFFRAPNIAAWRQIRRDLRQEIEAFCHRRVERIVRTLAPKQIVVIGLGTFDLLTTGGAALTGDRGVLIKSGSLWGTRCYGTVHLSGAQISRTDRNRLISYFAGTSQRG